jgi:hypothetical protein
VRHVFVLPPTGTGDQFIGRPAGTISGAAPDSDRVSGITDVAAPPCGAAAGYVTGSSV